MKRAMSGVDRRAMKVEEKVRRAARVAGHGEGSKPMGERKGWDGEEVTLWKPSDDIAMAGTEERIKRFPEYSIFAEKFAPRIARITTKNSRIIFAANRRGLGVESLDGKKVIVPVESSSSRGIRSS